MSPTAIRDVRFFTARSPLSRPIADATHAIPEIRFVVAGIALANGVTGQSHLLAFHYSRHAIAGACRDLEAFLRGRDACDTEAVIRDWDTESEYFGRAGVNRWALGLANLAMWDARGNTLGQPVWRLLGGQARPVPVQGLLTLPGHSRRCRAGRRARRECGGVLPAHNKRATTPCGQRGIGPPGDLRKRPPSALHVLAVGRLLLAARASMAAVS